MQNQTTRRSFLIASGLTALASNRVVGANDTLRIGVIGAGSRMGGLLNAADQSGPYQIIAVSDVYGPRCDAVKTRSNGIANTRVGESPGGCDYDAQGGKLVREESRWRR